MLALKNRVKLAVITILVDLGYVYGMYTFNLNEYDQIFSLSVLFVHSVFLYYLYKNDQKKLDFLHYLVPVLLIGSVGLRNPFLIFFSLILLCMVKTLWILEGRCILNDEKDTWGLTKFSEFGAIILTVLLSVKFGYNIKKT